MESILETKARVRKQKTDRQDARALKRYSFCEGEIAEKSALLVNGLRGRDLTAGIDAIEFAIGRSRKIEGRQGALDIHEPVLDPAGLEVRPHDFSGVVDARGHSVRRAHGLYHFLRSDTTTDMKFALLHIDQSIELLLKERVRQSGNSIYKNPKETISIWGAYEILENKVGCRFPEKPDLELLHEERNNIQHKYSNPNADDAAFHVEHAMKFIERFTRDELGLVLADFLPSEFLLKVLS